MKLLRGIGQGENIKPFLNLAVFPRGHGGGGGGWWGSVIVNWKKFGQMANSRWSLDGFRVSKQARRASAKKPELRSNSASEVLCRDGRPALSAEWLVGKRPWGEDTWRPASSAPTTKGLWEHEQKRCFGEIRRALASRFYRENPAAAVPVPKHHGAGVIVRGWLWEESDHS